MRKILDLVLFPFYILLAIVFAVFYAIGEMVFNICNLAYLYWKDDDEEFDRGSEFNQNH